MRAPILAAATAVFLATALPAWAHHSAAEFDLTVRNRTWTGVIKEFKPKNPHTRIVLEVATSNGGTKDVAFEGNSRNNMFRSGWRPDSIKVGDKVTITAAPRKDGTDGGFVFSIVTADGRKY